MQVTKRTLWQSKKGKTHTGRPTARIQGTTQSPRNDRRSLHDAFVSRAFTIHYGDLWQ
jgi:hypothetical protein